MTHPDMHDALAHDAHPMATKELRRKLDNGEGNWFVRAKPDEQPRVTDSEGFEVPRSKWPLALKRAIPETTDARPAWDADIDFPWHDGPEWVENKHPRGGKGTSVGGQFVKGQSGSAVSEMGKAREREVEGEAAGREGRAGREEGTSQAPTSKTAAAAKTVPDPPPYWKTPAGKKLQSLARQHLVGGTDPLVAAKAIVDMAKQWQHKSIQGFANKMIRHIADAHGIDGAKLIATARGEAPTKPGLPPIPPPPPRPVTPPVGKTPPKGKAPQTIQDVLANRPDWSLAEKSWHQKTWQNATPEFLAAMQNVYKLNAVTNATRGCFYQPGMHVINMATGRGPQGADTWRHEYGHAMDSNGFGKGFSSTCEAERTADKAEFVKTYLSPSPDVANLEPKDIKRIAAENGLTPDDLAKHAGGSPQSVAYVAHFLAGRFTLAGDPIVQAQGNGRPALMDFIGAMTMNQIGYGHSIEYYKKRSDNMTAEMFAEYVELTQGPSGNVYKAILHKIAPRVCPKFDEYISALAKGKLGMHVSNMARGKGETV
jgi:hypothetical protein